MLRLGHDSFTEMELKWWGRALLTVHGGQGNTRAKTPHFKTNWTLRHWGSVLQYEIWWCDTKDGLYHLTPKYVLLFNNPAQKLSCCVWPPEYICSPETVKLSGRHREIPPFRWRVRVNSILQALLWIPNRYAAWEAEALASSLHHFFHVYTFLPCVLCPCKDPHKQGKFEPGNGRGGSLKIYTRKKTWLRNLSVFWGFREWSLNPRLSGLMSRGWAPLQ